MTEFQALEEHMPLKCHRKTVIEFFILLHIQNLSDTSFNWM